MGNPSTSTLRAQLIRTFEDPTYRPPPLPPVVLELHALTAKLDANVDDVVRVLERDQLMAGTVIRLVGSPIHAGRGPVRSLSDAVLRLGIRTIRDSVFAAAMKKGLFNSTGEYGEILARVGRHGTATAYLARVVCRYARVVEEQAFLGALLHDVGFAALLYTVLGNERTNRPPLLELWPEIDALIQDSRTLLGLRDDALDRITAEAAPILLEVLSD